MEDTRNAHRVLLGKLEWKEHVEDIWKDRAMALKSFFKK